DANVSAFKTSSANELQAQIALPISQGSCRLGFAQRHWTIVGVSPAAQTGGLRVGDAVVSIAGQSSSQLTDALSLAQALRSFRRGDDVPIVVRRSGSDQSIRLVCADALPGYQATIDALDSAARGAWDECMRRANILESKLELQPPPEVVARLRNGCSL